MKTKLLSPFESVAKAAACLLALTLLTVNSKAQSISGTVFEDANYGGGAGRSLAASAGSPRPSATVELYNAAGAFVSSVATNASGVYTFTGLSGSTFFVRVVNQSVSSARSGYVNTLIPVQTYRTNAPAGTVVPVTDRVGGEVPSEQDAAANTSSATMASINATAGTEIQSVAQVSISSGSVSGIDFGFNFNTIVNINLTGQGCLQQFFFNATALGGETLLAQSGNTWNALGSVNAAQPLPAGIESTIFMISDGNAHPGLRAGLANLLSVNGVAVIPTGSLGTPYALTQNPSLSNSSIDGGTQTANVGNTNNVMLGTGGTVGVGADGVSGTGDELAVEKLNGPEVEIAGIPGQYPLELYGTNVTLRCIAVHSNSADIRPVSGSNFLLEQNVIGAEAHTFTPPATLSGNSGAVLYVQFDAASGTIRNNMIGFGGGNNIIQMRYYQGTNYNWVIKGNEIAGGIPGTPGGGPGIQLNDRINNNLVSALGTTLIEGNLIRDCGATGISTGLHYPNTTTNIVSTTVRNNSLIRSSSGFQALFGNGNDLVIYNLITANRGLGIRVANRPSTIGGSTTGVTTQVKISRNSIYNNGTAITGNTGLGIDLNEDGITPNNGALDPAFPNLRMNYPIFTSINLTGNTLTVAGYVGSAPGQSAFGNAAVEIFKANNADANQSGEIIVGDGLSVPHGEGETYLGTLTTNVSGNFSGSLTVTGLLQTDDLTATATKSDNNTSEFSPTIHISVVPVSLESFTAAPYGKDVAVRWTVGDEVNVSRYEVWFGTDGTHFQPAGSVNATGSHAYSFLHTAPAAGFNYYRLKTIDKDGRSSYSDVRKVRFGTDGSVSIYPNPTSSNVSITLNAAMINKPAMIQVIAADGRIVSQKNATALSQTETLDVSGFAAGSYILKVVTADEVVSKSFQVVHF